MSASDIYRYVCNLSHDVKRPSFYIWDQMPFSATDLDLIFPQFTYVLLKSRYSQGRVVQCETHSEGDRSVVLGCHHCRIPSSVSPAVSREDTANSSEHTHSCLAGRVCTDTKHPATDLLTWHTGPASGSSRASRSPKGLAGTQVRRRSLAAAVVVVAAATQAVTSPRQKKRPVVEGQLAQWSEPHLAAPG